MSTLPYEEETTKRFATWRPSGRACGILVRAVLLLVVITSSVAGAYAQGSPSPTPTPSEEELRLQEEKRLAELRRDIELAKKAIRDAQPEEPEKPAPPAPTTTPLAGDTTLENVKLEPEMVSYRAMSDAADIISKEIQQKKPGAENIAIYDAQVVRDWRYYKALFPAFQSQTNDLRNRYKTALCNIAKEFPDKKFVSDKYIALNNCPGVPQPAGISATGIQTAFAAGTNLLKSFIDLTALFRTETKIQGVSFTVEESALVAELFRALRNQYGAGDDKVRLYYPEVFPPRLSTDPQNPDPSSIVVIIGSLFLDKSEADDAIAKMSAEIEALNKKLKEPLDLKGKLEAQLSRIQVLDKMMKNLTLALAAETKPEVRKILFGELGAAKAELASLGAPTAASLKLKVDELKGDIKKQSDAIDPLEAGIKGFQAHIKLLTGLNTRFVAFVDESVKVGTSGTSPLATFVKSQDLDLAMPGSESYWLEIKSVSAGGNNRTRKNLLRYFTGAKLDHSGGIIVEYTLYDNTGAVVYSDKLSVYGGYVEPKTIRNRDKFKDVVTP
ncbi:MAG TPA: hypothetical protein VIQ24_19020 [Pyrinomonadaceae bacterium]